MHYRLLIPAGATLVGFVFNYLDAHYLKVDSSFFPMTINVGVFDPKPER